MSDGVRLRDLRASMAEYGVDALLVTHLPDVRWLCGFTGSNAALAVTATKAVLFTDGRYTVQAKEETRGARVVIAKKPALLAACEWLESAGVRRCGFDAAHTTVAALEVMRKAVSAKLRRGFFQPVEALLSPMLARLEDQKLVTSAWETPQAGGERPRRYYQLTGEGIRVARLELAQVRVGQLRAPVVQVEPAGRGHFAEGEVDAPN